MISQSPRELSIATSSWPGLARQRTCSQPKKTWMRGTAGFQKALWVGHPEPHMTVSKELIFIGFALLALVTAQLILSHVIHGTTYRGPDGGMIQANVFTALKFGGLFNITNLNPLQGLGSQLLPKNAWANPAFWPFAVVARETAADWSSAVALVCYALCCYAMARCFDLPVLPSAVAAQLCIVVFSPTLFIADTPRNFSPTPADAVTYAPYMLALGLLVRLHGESSRRQFLLVTIGIFACLLYSIYLDPAFTMIPAVSWSAAFAVVTFLPFRPRSIAARAMALASCAVALIVSGPAVYLYTLSQYSSRVYFAQTLDRVRILEQASALFFSEQLHRWYTLMAVGLLTGLLFARGRSRILVLAAVVSAFFYAGYAVVYILLLDAPWILPIPLYVEQSLFVLFMTGALAGFWALLHFLWSIAQNDSSRLVAYVLPAMPVNFSAYAARWTRSPMGNFGRIGASAAAALSVAVILIIPAKVTRFAIRDAPRYAELWYWPWAQEPELVDFLVDRTALGLGTPFRGSVNFHYGPPEDGTIDDLWSRSVPTANEYSQTASAPSLYFVHKLLNRDVRGLLNRFDYSWVKDVYSPTYLAGAQLLGVRYMAARGRLPDESNPGIPALVLPYHVPRQPDNAEPPGSWYLYELPHPNVGNYSPTEITTAASGAEIMTVLSEPGFDFTKRVVLTGPIPKPLVAARDVRLSLIRNGLHLSGQSDGTSLVILPQQFSHCLRASDREVRLVRSDFLFTGAIFTGAVDTDISFGYGLFSPWCRLTDLADMQALDIKIDLRMAHLAGGRLFPDWEVAMTRLKTAANRLPNFLAVFQ